MATTAEILWNAFLQSSPPHRRSTLLHCLTPELFAELMRLPLPAHDPQLGIAPVEAELPHIHSSWLAPFLRSLPENEIKIFLSCLSPEQIKGLKGALMLSNTLPTPSELGKTYLSKTLFDSVADSELIPLDCLPADPLNALLELSPEELSSLIDLLSMHDLSIEIRHVIETTKLKEINGLLSKPQTNFLKTLLHKKEPVAFKKMGLLNWKGDTNALRTMLLQRGINRIAKALHESSPSLLWYIAHRLDIERGQLLINLCTELDHPRALPLLTHQVVELIHALKNPNPPQGS